MSEYLQTKSVQERVLPFNEKGGKLLLDRNGIVTSDDPLPFVYVAEVLPPWKHRLIEFTPEMWKTEQRDDDSGTEDEGVDATVSFQFSNERGKN